MHSAEFIVSEEEMRHEEDEMRRWPCPQYDRDINDMPMVFLSRILLLSPVRVSDPSSAVWE